MRRTPPFISGQNKGMYAIVTTFLFVVISLVVVMGLIYYGAKFSIFERNFDVKLSKYTLVMDIKNKIYYCYGTSLQVNRLNTTCQMPPELRQFAGYSIERQSYGPCSPQQWNFSMTDYKEKYVYFVPLTNTTVEKTCPGTLTIYLKEV
jgi:hypothetical protein